MKDTAENLADDLSFCRERATEFDPWYGLHTVFAHQDQQHQLLGLYAFFAMMERAAAMSEPSLCATQLAWWQSEVGEGLERSAHPVIRALQSSGAMPVLVGGALPGLFSQALLRVQKNPLAKVDDLEALCDDIGNAYMSPQIALADADPQFATYSGSTAGTGLWRLVSLATRSPEEAWWFVPLDLQARHGVRLDRVGANRDGENQVFNALGVIAQRWFNSQLIDFEGSGHDAKAGYSHLVASLLTQERQLSLMLESPLRHGRRAPRPGLLELLRLWSNTRSRIRR